MTATGTGLRVCQVPYGHQDVQRLVARLQTEYVARYGGEDDSPTDAAELAPPGGVFLLAWRDGVPVAMGGWRRHVEAGSGRVPGERPAEIKRMYVVPEARGRGLARRLLGELERLAREAGVDQLVLETGQPQPEALELYRSAGYVDIDGFGYYCGGDRSVHLGKPLPPSR